MDWWLIFAIFLYVISALLLVAEVFIPSGGIITACSVACLVGGIAIFFNHSKEFGWLGIIIAVLLIPSALILAYKIFPKTSFARSISTTPPKRDLGDAIPDSSELQKLMGDVGEVITPLRPVGICDFSGQRVECVAENGYVDTASKVKVVRVQSTQVTVRLIEET